MGDAFVRFGLLENLVSPGDYGFALMCLGIHGISHPGVRGKIGAHSQALVCGEPALIGISCFNGIAKVTGNTRFMSIKSAPAAFNIFAVA